MGAINPSRIQLKNPAYEKKNYEKKSLPLGEPVIFSVESATEADSALPTNQDSYKGGMRLSTRHFSHTSLPQAHSDIYIIGGVRNRSGFRPTRLNHARMAKQVGWVGVTKHVQELTGL